MELLRQEKCNNMYEFYQAVESGEMTWSYYDRKNATTITAKSLAVMDYEQRG